MRGLRDVVIIMVATLAIQRYSLCIHISPHMTLGLAARREKGISYVRITQGVYSRFPSQQLVSESKGPVMLRDPSSEPSASIRRALGKPDTSTCESGRRGVNHLPTITKQCSSSYKSTTGCFIFRGWLWSEVGIPVSWGLVFDCQ